MMAVARITFFLTLTAACLLKISATPTADATEVSSSLVRVEVPKNCMASPSKCGFPDASNTGIPPGTNLTPHNGDMHIKQAGAVIDGLDITGCVYIEADNVTLKRSRVRGDCPDYAIRTFTGRGSVVGTGIMDVEIDLSGSMNTKGIAFDNYTADRVHFRNGADCAHFGSNVLIQNSFCELSLLSEDTNFHVDGYQSDGADNIVIRHNTIRNPNNQTSAILLSSNTSPIKNVQIVGNLMAGGGWTLYCAAAKGKVDNVQVSTNRFSRLFYPKGGMWGPAVFCERIGLGWSGDNIWDETGMSLE
jgi:hypothetical protein